MAKKAIYWVVTATGLALASGGAWWWQHRPAPDNGAAGAPLAPMGGGKPAGAPGAGGPGAPGGPAGGRGAAPGVEVTLVKAVPLQDDAQAVGTLRSRQSVVLRPEVGGRVAQLGFADGARVRKGQLLVQLDDILQQAELSQAQAQVSIARANLKRNQELVAEKFVSQRVVEESEANLQVVEAQLALAKARLARMRVVAPFDGTVGLRSVNVGDYVKDGADLVNLEDSSALLVDFRLPERFQGQLAQGQRVVVELDAVPGRKFEAKVQALDPLVDANGRSVAVRAQLPNTAPGLLRPGMFARTTTVFSVTDAALVVPEEAIVPQGGKQLVYVLDTEGEGEGQKLLSRKVEVKLGVRRASAVQVLEGLKAGDTVVVAGQQRLQKDGTAVRVVDLSGPPRKGPPGGPGTAPVPAGTPAKP